MALLSSKMALLGYENGVFEVLKWRFFGEKCKKKKTTFGGLPGVVLTFKIDV
jgi:hypothetical protein